MRWRGIIIVQEATQQLWFSTNIGVGDHDGRVERKPRVNPLLNKTLSGSAAVCRRGGIGLYRDHKTRELS